MYSPGAAVRSQVVCRTTERNAVGSARYQAHRSRNSRKLAVGTGSGVVVLLDPYESSGSAV